MRFNGNIVLPSHISKEELFNYVDVFTVEAVITKSAIKFCELYPLPTCLLRVYYLISTYIYIHHKCIYP